MDGFNEFRPGDEVIFGLHGKCTVLGKDTKAVGGTSLAGYRLQKLKTPQAKAASKQEDVFIFIPLSQASEQLRRPMTPDNIAAIEEVLKSGEYFFNMNTQWKELEKQFESAIRSDGAIGLAKVYSFLYVLKNRQVVTTPETSRWVENIKKLFFREVQDITGEIAKDLEKRFSQMMRLKLRNPN